MQNPKGNHLPLFDLPATLTTDQAVWHEARWGSMRVGFETYREAFDDTALLKGCPDDRCQCPHWGYLLTGRLTVRYPDHDEIVEPGEAYYMAPGHTMAVDAGTTLIEFSPADEFQKLMDTAGKNLPR